MTYQYSVCPEAVGRLTAEGGESVDNFHVFQQHMSGESHSHVAVQLLRLGDREAREDRGRAER